MNQIIALIAAIKLAFTDRMTPTASNLIGKISKWEQTIEQVIAKELKALEVLAANQKAIVAALKTKNSDVDLAYKLLNNVSRITA